jgi:hypothetical protein
LARNSRMRFWWSNIVTRSTGRGGGGDASRLASGLFEAEYSTGIGFGMEKAHRSLVALRTSSSSL